MVILTLITNSNDHTVYFEEPLVRGSDCIRLISCSLYNSWYNLKKRGEIGFVDAKGITTTKIIPPGNCTLDSIGKKLPELFERENVTVKFDGEKGPIFIDNPQNRKISFDRDLTFLLSLNARNIKENPREHLKTQINNFCCL